ncbi:hypothetical protein [Brevibacillus reuszeri]|uniref:hypothetical protein n=1 Tax=Brevibacillus reuszeri TaxID=54915 RepID=UPI0028A0D3B9|nr:hypothetical protein [Brevibacillus reuszeri]
MSKRYFPLISALLSLLLLAFPVNAKEDNSWDKQFRAQITEWKDAIANRDPGFKEWQQSEMDVQTLGTGQHQWLVSIKKSGKQVGYLVVGEAPDPDPKSKFVLLEYGLGEYILFDDAFAPREIAAEPVYDGFASHWLLTQNPGTHMVNAKTGESYPTAFVANDPVMGTLPAAELVHSGQHLTQTRMLKQQAADPFDQIGWVHQLQTTSDITWKQLWQEKEGTSVTLTVPLHHSEVLAPFVVSSLHLWDDQNAYVGVWDEGLRFVPYSYAKKVGQFYLNQTSSPAE